MQIGIFEHTKMPGLAPGKTFSVNPAGGLIKRTNGALTQSAYATDKLQTLKQLAVWFDTAATSNQQLTQGISRHPQATVAPEQAVAQTPTTSSSSNIEAPAAQHKQTITRDGREVLDTRVVIPDLTPAETTEFAAQIAAAEASLKPQMDAGRSPRSSQTA